MAITRVPPLLQILLIIYINGCLGYNDIDGMRHLMRRTISSNRFCHFAGDRLRCQNGILGADSEPLRTSEEITRSDYEFLDCGDLKRLERFGDVTVVRSCPSAIWPKKISTAAWNSPSNVVYDGSSGKNGKWVGINNIKPDWTVEFDNTDTAQSSLAMLTSADDSAISERSNAISEEKRRKIVFTLSCSDQGQLGVFPEQQENWKWIGDSIRKSLLAEKAAKEKKIEINPDDVLFEEYSAGKENASRDQNNAKRNSTQRGSGGNNTKIKDKKGSPSETQKANDVENVIVRRILNGFAYTGGSSLAALSGHDFAINNGFPSTNTGMNECANAVQVVHLDAAKSSVQWAMRNAVASGIISSDLQPKSDDDENSQDNTDTNYISANKNPDNVETSSKKSAVDKKLIDRDENDVSSRREIDELSTSLSLSSPPSTNSPSARWIIDDCLTFLEREIRRGNKYDGLIFDPPAFGRASNGKIWKLEKDLPVLVEEMIPKLLSADPLFVLLSCHDTAWPPERLAEILSVSISSVMRNAMILDIKAMKKKNKSKEVIPVQYNRRNDSKDKDKEKGKKSSAASKQTMNNILQNSNSNIQSVFLAGGVLEYGPMILSPNLYSNNSRKSVVGNSLPLGGFARWSKIIE